ncbi:MAG: DUF1922 domain-containing protein [Candidatus Bathyarchaeia archaeon]
MSFLIVVCSHCGKFLIANAQRKTRTCPHCGFKVVIERAKRVASAQNAYDASAILRRLKEQAALKRKGARLP